MRSGRPGYGGGGLPYGTAASGHPSIDGVRGPGFEVVFGRRLRDRYSLYWRRFSCSIEGLGLSPGAGVHVCTRRLGLYRVGPRDGR